MRVVRITSFRLGAVLVASQLLTVLLIATSLEAPPAAQFAASFVVGLLLGLLVLLAESATKEDGGEP